MQLEHTVRHEGGWQMVYWHDHRAATAHDADRVVLEQFHEGIGYGKIKEFKLPQEEYELRHIVSALELAYERGKVVRSRELRRLLGVNER